MDVSNRKRSMDNKNPICKYGDKCYRKNPTHLKDFRHQHLEDILANHNPTSKTPPEIPQELWFTKEVVRDQLEIVSKWFYDDESKQPAVSQPASKIHKTLDAIESPKMSKIAIPSTSNRTPSPKRAPSPKRTAVLKVTPDITPSTSNERASPSTSKRAHSPKRTAVLDTPKVTLSSSKLESAARKTPEDEAVVLAKKKELHCKLKTYFPVVMPMGKMAEKLEKAKPFNFFLTSISDSKPTHSEPLTITFQELLDHSLGNLESSVQINFMIDIGWLLGNYYFAGYALKPLLILYGDETPEIREIAAKRKNVVSVKVQMSNPFSCSHTKVGLYAYTDGSMRVVVSTANLYEDDWLNRVQGIWVSPRLPELPNGCDTDAGESVTGFRSDLLLYLTTYRIPELQPWISRIRKTDFSEINVFLVASAPGSHREMTMGKGYLYGHARLGYLLGKYSAVINDTVPIVCQSSSIGSLGPNPEAWVTTELFASFRRDSGPMQLRRIPPFKMIYPSFNNVGNSHDNLLGGGCLPYGKNINDKQPWLKNYLQQWKSKTRHRNQAMPHIKSYCRWTTEGVCWFLLTSANLSKAAWGVFNKSAKFDVPLRISNYEAGVLFLPKFVTGGTHFKLTVNNGEPVFPMPYDIPLTPYAPDDTPFLQDILHEKV